MKYIKRFNESLDSEFTKESIREIAEELLVELLDNEFKVSMSTWNNGSIIDINLNRASKFKWIDIKDIYIPFVLYMDEKFNVIMFRENVAPFIKFDSEHKISDQINYIVSDDDLVSLSMLIKNNV